MRMANRRVSTTSKCLFCNKSQPSTGEKSECYVEVSGKEMRKAFWICEQCSASEKDRTRALHGIVLAESKIREGRSSSTETAIVQVVTVDTVVSADVSSRGAENKESTDSSCSCQGCMERKQFQEDELLEAQNLQKCWIQLRRAVHQVYRHDSSSAEPNSNKRKKLDSARLLELVETLCARDPHQLYQRLESLGCERVLELKVHLLQILVCSPEKKGDSPKSDSQGLSSNISQDVAENFLTSFVNTAYKFFDVVDSMNFLAPFERDHLEKFGVTWRIVNGSLFDSMVYHDPIVQATLPAIYSSLGFQAVVDGDPKGENFIIVSEKKSVPTKIAETAEKFIELIATLTVCRRRMDLAEERMEQYLTEQMKIYKSTLKAKQLVLKNDLELFKLQRQVLEDYIAEKKDSTKTKTRQEDFYAMAGMLRRLISENICRRGQDHSTPSAECGHCHNHHCPCDQCSISHLITCGLKSDKHDINFSEHVQFRDDLHESSDSPASDSDVSECDPGKDCALNESPKVKLVCRKESSIISSDGKKITRVEATIVPANRYSMQRSDVDSKSVMQRHMYNASGDWEMNVDPSTVLFSNRWEETLFPKCSKQKVSRTSSGGDAKATSNNCDGADKSNKANKDIKCDSEKKATSDVSPTKVVVCKRHSLSSLPLPPRFSTKPAECNNTSNQSCKKGESNGNDQNDCCSPKKTSCGALPSCKTHSANRQQFTQEWFKDPKNVKCAKALLACSMVCDGKDATFLKDCNLDAETVKKIYAQHPYFEAMAKGADQPTAGAQNGDTGEGQKTNITKTVKAPRGESLSADEDDDSLNEHNCVSAQKEKHCDCCYCEMFGHGESEFRRSFGREEYPQIRERLRSKLKKKESDTPSHLAQNVDGYRGHEDLDSLLEYINGGSPKAGTNSAGNKTKKPRAKPKRNDNKKVEKREQSDALLRQSPTYQSNTSSGLDLDGDKMCENLDEELIAGARNSPQPNGAIQDNDAIETGHPRMSERLAFSQSNGRAVAAEDDEISIDEVFKPKDIDLDSTELDEAEREIEYFKRLVMNCQPQANRTKVQLNIGHLMREKKPTATPAAV